MSKNARPHEAPATAPMDAEALPRPATNRPLTFGLLGGAQNTGNLGVSALGAAAVFGLRRSFPHAKIVMQSHTRMARISIRTDVGYEPLDPLFLHASDHLYARYGTRHLAAVGRMARRLPAPLRRFLTRQNEALDRLLQCDLLLDVSGGDAFSDIYGRNMFHAQVAVKRLALRLGKPLVLLPQTFGPFRQQRSKRLAREILNQSVLVATREANGLEELEEILGEPLDDRFVACPDLAFTLPATPVAQESAPFPPKSPRDEQLIGINVSGLLYFRQSDFGLRFSYTDFVDKLIEWALRQHATKVVLVPHVLPHQRKGKGPQPQIDDVEASVRVVQRFGDRYPGRLARVEGASDASSMKYLIGRCDFFVGARMHACIAAVSQAIPTITIGYSKKAGEVMKLVGAGQSVIDARTTTLAAALDRIADVYRDRLPLRRRLRANAGAIRDRVDELFETNLKGRLRHMGLCDSNGNRIAPRRSAR